MEYLKIAEIKATRGLKGEVKIKSMTNMQNSRFKIGNKLFVIENGGYKPLVIVDYRVIKDIDVLTFKGYDDINKIEKFIGSDLFIENVKPDNLEDNEYLIEDIVGLKVYQNHVLKGYVKDVVTYPQGDYLEVETEYGSKLVPFRNEFILNQTDEEITIIEMEGLL
ncbi:MAG: ribosome maturation factor RimM [Candidatus Izemoplasmatales bacterium]|nr:ribosome maturation factor RimM [Candidatus Izemoplasmatales bacterium]